MVKIVLLVALACVVIWLLRGARRIKAHDRSGAEAPPALRHEDMVACAQCGIHLPRSEALPGQGGVFCGAAHRAEFEKSHTPP